MSWKINEATQIASVVGTHIQLHASPTQWIVRIGLNQRSGPAPDIETAKKMALESVKAELRPELLLIKELSNAQN